MWPCSVLRALAFVAVAVKAELFAVAASDEELICFNFWKICLFGIGKPQSENLFQIGAEDDEDADDADDSLLLLLSLCISNDCSTDLTELDWPSLSTSITLAALADGDPPALLDFELELDAPEELDDEPDPEEPEPDEPPELDDTELFDSDTASDGCRRLLLRVAAPELCSSAAFFSLAAASAAALASSSFFCFLLAAASARFFFFSSFSASIAAWWSLFRRCCGS